MLSTVPPHLLLPGPTPLPLEVLQAMSRPMINHRASDWEALYRSVEKSIQWLCQTQHDIVTLAGSGTTGMEAALSNCFSPGERILAISNGSFGERFAKMSTHFGLETDSLCLPWDHILSPALLEAHFAKTRHPYAGVLLIHNETSSGQLNPLPELLTCIHQHQPEALCLVDAISSLSTIAIHPDTWGIDILITASQKGYLAPPGLAILAVSERAWERIREARLPRYSLDMNLAREYAKSGWTPWTPPIPVFYALEAGFKLLQAEGLTAIHERHQRQAKGVRAGLRAMKLRLFQEHDTFASRAVTPVYPPYGLKAEHIRQHVLNRYNLMLAAGQRQFSDQIFRVGHLGHQPAYLLLGALAALENTLIELGETLEPGCATAAAQTYL